MSRFLDQEEDDPILSVVNLIDVFLVVIGILLIVIVQNPLNPFTDDDVMVIRNPGSDTMEIIVKQGEVLERYESSGEIGTGEGVKAGVAYRLPDGRMIYVPD
ncbi:hypothetical protein CAI21_11535 [Alkalilimnicola ehrlichii]|uniref:DUF2149 domain-containing protein n=1 Tax=Alkalilimnicola ehrlichii TaxID=351052 RepID=A0A3E0WGH9_9GAMM|nr:DUF2149 domain-containing protein [Alkalilimnicola ehrlichii]RFA29061.1 hypothetical protein CAI21_11535 [Alkalilimnicola ehrlichii]RFA31848.1 hypothetical protein CAL65_21360 [Alkalilimnicola ehrlichii]